MDLALLGSLAALALVDSTSFGTLALPVLMLARDSLRARNVLLYLLTICAFYWGLGVLLLAGLDTLLGAFHLPSGSGVDRAQLLLGVLLAAASFLIDGRARRRREQRRSAKGLPPKESRRAGWSDRVVGRQARPVTIVTVALAAGAVEAASMLPYLGAIGLLQRSDLPAASQGAVLVGYVLTMALPALALLGLRLVAARQMAPMLAWVRAWTQRNADDILGWVIGVIGVLLALDAIGRLNATGQPLLPW